MSETSSEPVPPAAEKKRRWHLGRWLLVLLAGMIAYAGWREYTYRRAVRVIEEAGYVWQHKTPFEIIRQDWRALFRKETWEEKERQITAQEYVDDSGTDFPVVLLAAETRRVNVTFFQALHRLQPTKLSLAGHQDMQTLESLRGLDTLKLLSIWSCPELQSLSGLEHLHALESLDVDFCPKLQDISAVQGHRALQKLDFSKCAALSSLQGIHSLPALKTMSFSFCYALRDAQGLGGLPVIEKLQFYLCIKLKDVSALQQLTSLGMLYLVGCDSLAKEVVEALRKALPQTTIIPPR